PLAARLPTRRFGPCPGGGSLIAPLIASLTLEGVRVLRGQGIGALEGGRRSSLQGLPGLLEPALHTGIVGLERHRLAEDRERRAVEALLEEDLTDEVVGVGILPVDVDREVKLLHRRRGLAELNQRA